MQPYSSNHLLGIAKLDNGLRNELHLVRLIYSTHQDKYWLSAG